MIGSVCYDTTFVTTANCRKTVKHIVMTISVQLGNGHDIKFDRWQHPAVGNGTTFATYGTTFQKYTAATIRIDSKTLYN